MALALAAEISQLRNELELLQNEKTQLTETVAAVNEIITAKDAEFHDVCSRIEAASMRLEILSVCVLMQEMNRCMVLMICISILYHFLA